VGLGVAAGVALAAGVESDGDGDGDRDVEGLAVGEVGDAVAERAGFGDPDGLAEGEVVGPSAIAGVPKKDTVNPTARSGGAKNRCACKLIKDCLTSLRERTQAS
jgi:hypothetical protein